MTRKPDMRHLYFSNRAAYWEMTGKRPITNPAQPMVVEEEIKLPFRLPDDWRVDNLDTLMEAAMAGDSLPTRTAQSLLLEAAEIVSGDRERTHGKKERSFEVIADFWDTYLTGRVDRATGRITALDVAQMMVLLKIARTIQGEPVWDHFIDAAGYSGVAGEIYASMKGTSHGPK